MVRYEYAVMPRDEVVALVRTFDAATTPGAYLSDDASHRDYCDLLARGFRWVRTDGDVAVFEKAIDPLAFQPNEG